MAPDKTSLTNLDNRTRSVRDSSFVDKSLPVDKSKKDLNYEQISRPFNSSGDRKVEPFFGLNYNPNEGEAIIKTGDSVTDIWVNTWIKSKNYLPAKRGFIINANKGLIEAEQFSSGWGIKIKGNDQFFFDNSTGGDGTVTGDVASLNFTRKNYQDQCFTIRKRVGKDSLSVSESDNVMDFFYPNPAQTNSKNYIFIGRGGSATYPESYNTNIISMAANDRLEIGIGAELSIGMPGILFARRASAGFGGDETANLVNVLSYIGDDNLNSLSGGGVFIAGAYKKSGGQQIPLNYIAADKDNFEIVFTALSINGKEFALTKGAFDPNKYYLREV